MIAIKKPAQTLVFIVFVTFIKNANA